LLIGAPTSAFAKTGSGLSYAAFPEHRDPGFECDPPGTTSSAQCWDRVAARMPSTRTGSKNGFSTMRCAVDARERMSARLARSITAALGSPVMRIAGVDIRRSRNFAIRSSPIMPGIFWSMTKQAHSSGSGESNRSPASLPLRAAFCFGVGLPYLVIELQEHQLQTSPKEVRSLPSSCQVINRKKACESRVPFVRSESFAPQRARPSGDLCDERCCLDAQFAARKRLIDALSYGEVALACGSFEHSAIHNVNPSAATPDPAVRLQQLRRKVDRGTAYPEHLAEDSCVRGRISSSQQSRASNNHRHSRASSACNALQAADCWTWVISRSL
jgi:hypothetical protein